MHVIPFLLSLSPFFFLLLLHFSAVSDSLCFQSLSHTHDFTFSSYVIQLAASSRSSSTSLIWWTDVSSLCSSHLLPQFLHSQLSLFVLRLFSPLQLSVFFSISLPPFLAAPPSCCFQGQEERALERLFVRAANLCSRRKPQPGSLLGNFCVQLSPQGPPFWGPSTPLNRTWNGAAPLHVQAAGRFTGSRARYH